MLHVLIPDGGSPFSLLVAKCLKRGLPGVKITAAYVQRTALCRWSHHVDHRIHNGADDVVGGLEKILQRGGYDLMLPVSGPGIALVSANADRFRKYVTLPAIPSPAVLDLVNDKWAFHCALMEWNIRSPRTVLLDDAAALDVFDEEVPLIAKPRAGSGGKGIVRFDRAAELRCRIHEFLGDGHPYIVQEFLVGRDIDRSVLFIDGWTRAATVQRSVGHQAGFTPASALQFLHDPNVEQVVDQLLRKLRYEGIAHLDLRYDARTNSLHVIELNPRYWATLLGSLSAGVNFPKFQAQWALGEKENAPEFKESYYVGLRAWPTYFRRQQLSIRNTSFFHNLSDPLPKLLGMMWNSSAFGKDKA